MLCAPADAVRANIQSVEIRAKRWRIDTELSLLELSLLELSLMDVSLDDWGAEADIIIAV
jgi:hypothetical protein